MKQVPICYLYQSDRSGHNQPSRIIANNIGPRGGSRRVTRAQPEGHSNGWSFSFLDICCYLRIFIFTRQRWRPCSPRWRVGGSPGVPGICRFTRAVLAQSTNSIPNLTSAGRRVGPAASGSERGELRRVRPRFVPFPCQAGVHLRGRVPVPVDRESYDGVLPPARHRGPPRPPRREISLR